MGLSMADISGRCDFYLNKDLAPCVILASLPIDPLIRRAGRDHSPTRLRQGTRDSGHTFQLRFEFA